MSDQEVQSTVPAVLRLDVTQQEFSVIQHALGELPHKVVGALVQKMNRQLAEQAMAQRAIQNAPKTPANDVAPPSKKATGGRSKTKSAPKGKGSRSKANGAAAPK